MIDFQLFAFLFYKKIYFLPQNTTKKTLEICPVRAKKSQSTRLLFNRKISKNEPKRKANMADAR
jgi:hypothetical protein